MSVDTRWSTSPAALYEGLGHLVNFGSTLRPGEPPGAYATPTLGSDKPPEPWWWKKVTHVAHGENGGDGDGWEDGVTEVRAYNTKTSRYETLQTYGDHYRFLTDTRLHEDARSGSGDEREGAPQHECAPHTWFLESAAIDVAAAGYYGLFTGQRTEYPNIDMLNDRGNRDYSSTTVTFMSMKAS